MPIPLVAVSAYHLRPGRVSGWQDGAAAVPAAYTAALGRAGVRPAILAAPDPGPVDELLEPFAGVVLLGGGGGYYYGGGYPHAFGGGFGLVLVVLLVLWAVGAFRGMA